MFSDSDLVFTYTRQQAIEDGTLVDLSANYKNLCREHFKYPIACTSAVWNTIDMAVKNEKFCNDYQGVIHDILGMSKHGKPLDKATNLFQVIITGVKDHDNSNNEELEQDTISLKIQCGPGDNKEPVMTIMYPEED